MVETAIIIPVYNTPPSTLERTFRGIVESKGCEDVGIVVINDGSDDEHCQAYAVLRQGLRGTPCAWIDTSTLRERPEAYHIGEHNNPAFVINLGIERAAELGAERAVILSSDVIVSPYALQQARTYSKDQIVVGCTVDSYSRTIFCCTKRIWPMCWFASCGTEHMLATRFDEEYLQGMAFEDNDFMGRLFLRTGSLVISDAILCVHQSHPQTAYSDGLKGFRANEAYTLKKWGGVPFRPYDSALRFDVVPAEMSVVLSNPKAVGLGVQNA